MRKFKGSILLLASGLVALLFTAVVQAKEEIIHDAEYNILKAQNGERWDADDEQIDAFFGVEHPPHRRGRAIHHSGHPVHLFELREAPALPNAVEPSREVVIRPVRAIRVVDRTAIVGRKFPGTDWPLSLRKET